MGESLLDTGSRKNRSLWPWALTTSAHVLLAAAVGVVVVRPAVVLEAAALVEFVEIVPPLRESPPPELAVEPPAIPAPKRVAVSSAAPKAPAPTPQPVPAPPSAAQAGKILSQDSEVIDFSHSFVIGGGSKYAGGSTDGGGSSAQAVRSKRARGNSGGVTPGAAPVVQAPTLNHSRAPRLSGGASWSCPFPAEADVAGMNAGLVSLRVAVGASGEVASVQVLSEPGFGFGMAAKRCAMRKRWDPGLDVVGRAVAATAVVNVRFVR